MTGRRHQLRVHCLSIGHPIVGDATYTPITRNIRRPGTVPDPLVEPDRYLPALRPTLKDTASLEDSRLIERESDERMMLHAQILRYNYIFPLNHLYFLMIIMSEYVSGYHCHRLINHFSKPAHTSKICMKIKNKILTIQSCIW